LSTDWFFKVFFLQKKQFGKNNIVLKHLSKLYWHTYGILIIILLHNDFKQAWALGMLLSTEF
jgi:hypothetical protein